jgi:hypothetical protein
MAMPEIKLCIWFASKISKKMLSKEPKGKTNTMFSKCRYIHDYIWVCVKGLLKW